MLNSDEGPAAAHRALLRVGVGIFLTMNVMVFSFPFYEAGRLSAVEQGLTDADAALDSLLRWLLLLLAAIVMATLTPAVAAPAFESLRRGRIEAKLLVIIGAWAAFLISAWAVIVGHGHIYFDSACAVLTLVTVGDYLDARAKRAAAIASGARLADAPTTAIVETEEGETEMPASSVEAGHIVRVPTGAAIPVDGAVIRGIGAVIEASLTGEAAPRAVREGDHVWAGSTLVEGALRLCVIASGEERRIEQIYRQIDEARSAPPLIQRLTDRVSAVFVPTAILIAIAAFAWGAWTESFVEGTLRGLAVALIACPCALGIAAPLTTWTAIKRLAGHGVIARSGRALELAANVERLFFDKTGTLTTGEFEIERVERLVDDVDPLPIAAGLEEAAQGPVANAIRRAASPVPFDETGIVPGYGVRGRLGQSTFELGRPEMAPDPNTAPSIPPAFDELHSVILWRDGEPLAIIGLTERERSDGAEATHQLQSLGLDLEILTGDASPTGRAAVERLDLPARFGLTPEEKRAIVCNARHESKQPVAFVGDGVNDAPALAEADLGVAVSGGADLAKLSGSVVLLNDTLDGVVDLIHVARETRRRIAGSLIWAFSYNIVGISLAFTGRLSPIYAALAMALSSAFIIWNACRPSRHVRGAVDLERIAQERADAATNQAPAAAPAPTASASITSAAS